MFQTKMLESLIVDSTIYTFHTPQTLGLITELNLPVDFSFLFNHVFSNIKGTI